MLSDLVWQMYSVWTVHCLAHDACVCVHIYIYIYIHIYIYIIDNWVGRWISGGYLIQTQHLCSRAVFKIASSCAPDLFSDENAQHWKRVWEIDRNNRTIGLCIRAQRHFRDAAILQSTSSGIERKNDDGWFGMLDIWFNSTQDAIPRLRSKTKTKWFSSYSAAVAALALNKSTYCCPAGNHSDSSIAWGSNSWHDHWPLIVAELLRTVLVAGWSHQ